MDIFSIVQAVVSLAGVAGGLYAFLFIREEKRSRNASTDSTVIANFNAILQTQEAERQRLLSKCNKKSEEIEKWRSLYESKRCDNLNCAFRRPPLDKDLPQSEADTL